MYGIITSVEWLLELSSIETGETRSFIGDLKSRRISGGGLTHLR